MDKRVKFTVAAHEPLPDPVTFAAALHRALHDSAPNELTKSEWTHVVANAVAELCPVGLHVYGKQWRTSQRGEYLLDQCWRQSYADSAAALSIPGPIVFAMECEWLTGIREQFRDFHKLLDVRSKLCLYVGAISRTRFIEDVVTTLLIITSLHSTFFGELIIYHFDRTSPDSRFSAWLISRSDAAQKPSIYSLTEYLRSPSVMGTSIDDDG